MDGHQTIVMLMEILEIAYNAAVSYPAKGKKMTDENKKNSKSGNDETKPTEGVRLNCLVSPGETWKWMMYTGFDNTKPRYYTRKITDVAYRDWMDRRNIITVFWEKPLPGNAMRTCFATLDSRKRKTSGGQLQGKAYCPCKT